MPNVRHYCTGFGKFKGVEDNPTTHLVRALEGCDEPKVQTCTVFEVSTAAVQEHLPPLINTLSSTIDGCDNLCVILSWGVAATNKTVDVEIVASNEDNFRVPDEQGCQPKEQLIDPEGPPELHTQLPGALLVEMMLQRGHSMVRLSKDAGRFLCNHIYHKSIAATQQLEPKVGRSELGWPRAMSLFVHVPSHDVLGPDALKSVALDLMRCITTVVSTMSVEDAFARNEAIIANNSALWTERGTAAAKSAVFNEKQAEGDAAAGEAGLAAAAVTVGSTAAQPGGTGGGPAAPENELVQALIALGFEPALSAQAAAVAGKNSGSSPSAPGQPSDNDDQLSAAVAWILQQQEGDAGQAVASGPSSAADASGGQAHAAAASTSVEPSQGQRPPRYKLAVVVRGDLQMGAGKIAAQSCHGTLKAAHHGWGSPDPDRRAVMSAWQATGEPIVVLKCDSLAHLETLEETARAVGVPCARVRDAGRTQVAPGTVTVLAVGPAEEGFVDVVTGSLKLL